MKRLEGCGSEHFQRLLPQRPGRSTELRVQRQERHVSTTGPGTHVTIYVSRHEELQGLASKYITSIPGMMIRNRTTGRGRLGYNLVPLWLVGYTQNLLKFLHFLP